MSFQLVEDKLIFVKGIKSLSLKKEKDTLCYMNHEEGENASLKSWFLRVGIIQNKEK